MYMYMYNMYMYMYVYMYMYIYIYIRASVCVCVRACVCVQPDSKLRVLVRHQQQGGNDSFGVHCPTKTAPLECDIKRGCSLDIPASDMATRPSQKPGKPRVL